MFLIMNNAKSRELQLLFLKKGYNSLLLVNSASSHQRQNWYAPALFSGINSASLGKYKVVTISEVPCNRILAARDFLYIWKTDRREYSGFALRIARSTFAFAFAFAVAFA